LQTLCGRDALRRVRIGWKLTAVGTFRCGRDRARLSHMGFAIASRNYPLWVVLNADFCYNAGVLNRFARDDFNGRRLTAAFDRRACCLRGILAYVGIVGLPCKVIAKPCQTQEGRAPSRPNRLETDCSRHIPTRPRQSAALPLGVCNCLQQSGCARSTSG